MNNEMPEDVWVDHSVMICWPDGEQPKNADITRYVRADKAAPVERIEGLDGVIDKADSPFVWTVLSPQDLEKLTKAARAYLKLQGGE